MKNTPITTHGAWALTAEPAWQFRLDVPPAAMHAAPDDSFLLVADVFGNVHCLDTATGESRWKRTFGMHNVHGLRATTSDGNSLILLEDGRLVRLDRDGDVKWEADVGALRSGFDANADGSLVALCAAVHSVSGSDVHVGSQVTLHGEGGKQVSEVALAHVVNRLRFISEGGNLVCSSPDGEVSFLRDGAFAGSAQLASPVDNLVACLDGSLILLPAGRDGIHVLSADVESLGVYPVGGTVEDVDVSEDGSAILVKERDGLVYLLDQGFAVRWVGRMDRPVLRVDLAEDGSYVYLAESSGRIVRVDFAGNGGAPGTTTATGDGGTEATALAEYDLSGVGVRAGLSRIAFVGAKQRVAVLPRPGKVLVFGDGSEPELDKQLTWSAAHLSCDAARDRLAPWSHGRLEVLGDGDAEVVLDEHAVAAVEFLVGGDLAVGTTGGQLRRFGPDGSERWTTRAGAGVLALAQDPASGVLTAVCADGSLALFDGEGERISAVDLSASVISTPDVAAEAKAQAAEQEGDSAAEVDETVDFWSHFGREFRVVISHLGPVVFHGGGRVVRLDAKGKVIADKTLSRELHRLLAVGDTLVAVETSGMAAVLDAELGVERSFQLGNREAAVVAASDAGPAGLLDAVDGAVVLRDLEGAVIRRAAVSSAVLALAASADGSQGAALLDGKLVRFDLRA